MEGAHSDRRSDERAVPAREGRSEVRERASRFLAFARECSTPESAAETVAALRREFHDATHVAFAWLIGPPESVRTRASDDGEPSGTAGRPIAASIESSGLTDVVVAVVRYYGGTKLGTGGLARAYRGAAAGALEDAGRALRVETRGVLVRCAYARIGELKRLVRPPEVAVAEESFGEDARVRLAVYPSRVESLLAELAEARLDYELV